MNSTAGTQLGGAVTMSGLHNSQFHEMAARANGDAYRIFVGGPVALEEGRKYPAVYVLDGKLNFAMVHAQCQLLSALGQIPPVFVIGVAYAGDESFFEKDHMRRLRDLTPDHGGILEAAMMGLNDASGTMVCGHAPAFLAFLRDELRPAVEAAYPVDPHDATILGNSLSGLFPSWVLFREPGVFQRYVIVSPSWWWDGYAIWDWESQYAQRHRELDATIFVSAGGFETAEAHQAMIERMASAAEGEAKRRLDRYIEAARTMGWPRMAEITPEFAARLESRGYAGLDLAVQNFPDETHESVPCGAFSRGLRFVFGAWRPK